jgi:hypothetical protein
VGGHRLAPNVLYFPAGLYYGRIRPNQAQAFIAQCVRDEVFLEQLRGRSCYPPVVQAAEHFLYQQTGRLEMDAFNYLDAAETGPETWLVRFSDLQDRRLHQLLVAVDVTATPIRQSCGKAKTEPLVNYELVDYQKLAIG